MKEPEVNPRSGPPYPRHYMYLLDDYSSKEDNDVDVKPACNNEIVITSNARQSTKKAVPAKKYAKFYECEKCEKSYRYVKHLRLHKRVCNNGPLKERKT